MWKNEEAHKETKATSTLLSALGVGGLFEFTGWVCGCCWRVFGDNRRESVDQGFESKGSGK